MDNNSIDELLKNALSETQPFPYKEKNWEALSARLDAFESAPKTKVKHWHHKAWYLGGLLAVVAAISFWIVPPGFHKSQQEVITNQWNTTTPTTVQSTSAPITTSTTAVTAPATQSKDNASTAMVAAHSISTTATQANRKAQVKTPATASVVVAPVKRLKNTTAKPEATAPTTSKVAAAIAPEQNTTPAAEQATATTSSAIVTPTDNNNKVETTTTDIVNEKAASPAEPVSNDKAAAPADATASTPDHKEISATPADNTTPPVVPVVPTVSNSDAAPAMPAASTVAAPENKTANEAIATPATAVEPTTTAPQQKANTKAGLLFNLDAKPAQVKPLVDSMPEAAPLHIAQKQEIAKTQAVLQHWLISAHTGYNFENQTALPGVKGLDYGIKASYGFGRFFRAGIAARYTTQAYTINYFHSWLGIPPPHFHHHEEKLLSLSYTGMKLQTSVFGRFQWTNRSRFSPFVELAYMPIIRLSQQYTYVIQPEEEHDPLRIDKVVPTGTSIAWDQFESQLGVQIRIIRHLSMELSGRYSSDKSYGASVGVCVGW